MLPPDLTEIFVEGMHYYEEYEYYGPGAAEDIAWAVQEAEIQTTTLDEFLKANPFKLE